MKATIRFLAKRLVLSLINLLAGRPQPGPLNIVRRWLAGLLGMRLGPGGLLSEELYVFDGRKISIGANFRLGAFAKIWDLDQVSIGDDLLASHNLTLICGTHRLSDFKAVTGPISIGHGVWIGINVTIVGPVTIGDGAVIGAGSLVTKDVAPNTVVAGTPARLIRMRDQSLTPEQLESLSHP